MGKILIDFWMSACKLGLFLYCLVTLYLKRSLIHNGTFKTLSRTKGVMYGKLFQRCTHLLYCSVLSLGGNINTRRISQPDMGSIFHIKNQWNILVIGNDYVNFQNYQNSMPLTSSDTKKTMMHLFLFTNSAQRELVSMCTLSIRNCN